MKVTRAIVLGVAVSALSFGAYAADAGKSSKENWPSFRKADADNNGAVSMDEARSVPGLSDNFAQYDKNGDGQLSRSEYEAAKKAVSKSSKSGAMKSPEGSSNR